MRPSLRSLLLVLVGVVLLANGLYLFPGNVSYEDEYRATAEKADWPTGEFGGATIREGVTPSLDERLITQHLVEGGEIRVEYGANASKALSLRAKMPPEYVLLDDGYHRRTVTRENDTLVVGMREVARERALRTAATNASEVHPVVRRAIENGSAATTDRLADRTLLVADGGEYYLVKTSGPHRGDLIGLGWREPGRGVVGLLRYAGWLSGLALVWYGGYRYANRS